MSEIREGRSGSLFDHWSEVVQAIGHPESPFLSAEYSPDRRIPSRGFVEWIADAFLAGEIDSIARLLCEIARANPGVWSGNIDLMDTFGRLPRDLGEISLEGTVTGLDSRQLTMLLSAYTLQASIDGYQEEFILIRPGRLLMAASVLPWDIGFPAAEECVRNANNFIKSMRKDTPFWRDIPLYKVQDLAPFDVSGLKALETVRQRLLQLSVSARMHFLNAVEDCRGGLARRPLAACPSMETRGFGCASKETGSEILATGLIRTRVDLGAFAKWFKKGELQELLTRRGASFKKSAPHTELFALALSQTPEELSSMAREKGVFALATEVQEVAEVLLTFYRYETSRLGVWAAGALVPQLKEVRRAGGVFVGR